MDLITHVLISYLLTLGVVGLHPQYVAAGALAGGLPDADALLFPLGRRWAAFRHRGITHSFLGVTVVAVVAGALAPLIAPGSALVYAAVFELGGLLHIGLDAFTNYSVPPLLPFSRQRICYDAERAVNFGMLVFSVLAMYLLLGVERNQVALGIYWATVDALGAFFAAYLALRLSLRFWLGRAKSRFGPFDHVVPTETPFRWYLYGDRTEGGHRTIAFGRYRLGRGFSGPYVLTLPTTVGEGPIATPAAAIARSAPFREGGPMRRWEDSFQFADATRRSGGGWKVVWYSIEFGTFGRWATVEVDLADDPAAPPVAVRRGFRRVRMPWDPAEGRSTPGA
ncbi:MAG: metal-dependent hydrolase [Thermoplasmata archaeon]